MPKKKINTDKSKYYIRNEDLIPYIYQYRETGIVSEELGEMLLKIAAGFANRGSYRSYTWIEDMKQEAVFTCLRYMLNFDPLRYKRPNPFGYFSCIIYHSFLNYIRKQKKHSQIKDYCYNNYQLFNDTSDECFFEDAKGIDYTILKK